MAKYYSPNKVLDEVCEDNAAPAKSFHKFKKNLTKRDFNRNDKEKKIRQDEINEHISNHQGQVREGLRYIMEGWKLTYTHPAKRYLTLTHPDERYNTFTVNGEDNVSEIEAWISQYGFNYGIYLANQNLGNSVLPADFLEKFRK